MIHEWLVPSPLQRGVNAIYEGFDELGAYRIVIYATDNQKLQGEPKEVRVGSELYLPTTVR